MEEKERSTTLSTELPAVIKAKIVDDEKGATLLENIQAIRIKNNLRSILIMADFTPSLGRIHGNVSFLLKDKEINTGEVRGFYKHMNNEFTLITENSNDGWYKYLKEHNIK